MWPYPLVNYFIAWHGITSPCDHCIYKCVVSLVVDINNTTNIVIKKHNVSWEMDDIANFGIIIFMNSGYEYHYVVVGSRDVTAP